MARRTFSRTRTRTARRTLVALAVAGIALGAGAATACAADDGGDRDVSGLTGSVAQTGQMGAVPALERVAEGLLSDGDD